MKNIFDLTQGELDRRTVPLINQLVTEQFEKVGYIQYQDKRCPDLSYFVREYTNGMKDLVRMGAAAGQYEVIRSLD